MSPAHSRAFWALIILAHVWLVLAAISKTDASAVIALSVAFAYAFSAVGVGIKDSLERRFGIGPGRGDLDR